jgi:hypothetical protein
MAGLMLCAPAEGHALGATAAGGHAVDLRAAATVADEVDHAAVRAVDGLGVDGTAVGQAARAAAVARHHEQLRRCRRWTA